MSLIDNRLQDASSKLEDKVDGQKRTENFTTKQKIVGILFQKMGKM